MTGGYIIKCNHEGCSKIFHAICYFIYGSINSTNSTNPSNQINPSNLSNSFNSGTNVVTKFEPDLISDIKDKVKIIINKLKYFRLKFFAALIT